MAYRDELDAMLERESELRQQIARCLAEQSDRPRGVATTEVDIAAADEAIASWAEDGEDEHDLRAFRPMGPLQQLLVEHHSLVERILDTRDRRLS